MIRAAALATLILLITYAQTHAEIVQEPEAGQIFYLVIGACEDMTGYGSPVEFCAGQYWWNPDENGAPVTRLTWHIYCWEDIRTERISEWQTVQFIDHRLTIEEQDRLDNLLFMMADGCPRSSS